MKTIDPPTEEAVEERMLRDFATEDEARAQLVTEAREAAEESEPEAKTPRAPKKPKKTS